MRISDWSSDVCSSDLRRRCLQIFDDMRFDAGVANERERVARRPALGIVIDNDVGGHAPVSRSPVAPSMPPISFNLRAIAISSMLSFGSARMSEIGRASRRERGCQYV